MGGDVDINNEEMGLMEMDDSGMINIKQIAGVIDSQEVARLRRLIFRVTKGKSYMYIQKQLHAKLYRTKCTSNTLNNTN